MLEVVKDEVEIVNLYKTGSHAPYTPLEKGHFGYLGILLSRKSDGKVQCHVCGKWFNGLGPHIYFKHRQFRTVSEYKQRFGFPVLFPLCSQNSSEKRSVKNRERAKKLAEQLSEIRHLTKTPAAKRKQQLSRKKTLKTASYLNSMDICADQTRRRVNVITEHLKRFPKSDEMRQYDPAILAIIIKRYGSWNKFKTKEFPTEKLLSPSRPGPPEKYSSDHLLFILRDFKRTTKKVPTSMDFSKTQPHYATFILRFGSWSRALSLAGLQINPKELKTYRKGA